MNLRHLLAVAALAVPPLFAAAEPPTATKSTKVAEKAASPGAEVVEFARENLGKKVGDGECAALVMEAYKKIDAKTTVDYGVTDLDGDYVWGEEVTDLKEVKPGDVIQFRDLETVTKTVTQQGNRILTRTATRNYGHHTAIVSKVLGDGRFLTLEQNAGTPDQPDEERKKVQENELNLKDRTGGKYWIYRPVLKSSASAHAEEK